jgi:tRNA pseudouridine38-40 synthase
MQLLGYTWWLRPAQDLNVEAMNEAAQLLVGEHDFTSFCKVTSARMLKEQGRSTSRNVMSLSVTREQEMGEQVTAIDITGNAFLHNMVRIITGTLVEVGREHRDPAWVGEVLAAQNRTAAAQTAPPEGLTFTNVSYPDGLLSVWE